MTYQDIQFELANGIARLTLNRPDKLNSFTANMHGEVADALTRVETEGARVLVLTGAGRGFCAGQDLSERKPAPDG
ncbi:MAG: enoyl-CoA hydratase-related protein, partial [Achromobacter xylosoxidans]|nr:enoyl-CoA hydratase-related protein [Achromobacter xylosoxidans]